MPLHISLTHQFEQQGETNNLAFSPDGTHLLSWAGNALYHWQLQSNHHWHFQDICAHTPLLSIALHHAHYMKEGLAVLFPHTEREMATFPPQSSHVWTLSPDLRWLVSSDDHNTILVWDRTTQESFSPPLPFPVSDDESNPLTSQIGRFLFTPDVHHVLLWADSPEGSIHICAFDPESPSLTLEKTFPHGMMDWAISPDSTMLALIVPNEEIYSDFKEEIYLYDLTTFQRIHIFSPNNQPFYNLLAFSPDSRYLASCKDDGWVDVFSIVSGERIAQFPAHPGLSSHASNPIEGLAWSSTGYLATGGASVFEKDMKKKDYSVKLWKVEEY